LWQICQRWASRPSELLAPVPAGDREALRRILRTVLDAAG
jgi:hypothetical protein